MGPTRYRHRGDRGEGRGTHDGTDSQSRFYRFRARASGAWANGNGILGAGLRDGGSLRRMVGGFSLIIGVIWTLIWLAFYTLVGLVGDLLVWLSRTVFEAQGLADFFAGLFGLMQDAGVVTIALIWLSGIVLIVGFNLVTHRATRDAEARWSGFHGERARPVGGASTAPGPASTASRRSRTAVAKPVTIELRRDGDAYR